MRATGVGSMPGEDLAETLKVLRGELGALLFVPELPARGVHAGMTGRSLAVLDGLVADLQPSGWRLADGPGVDLRRARSLLAQDLDAVEEQWHDIGSGEGGVLKQQVVGPWTLAATVELPRGEKVLSDHGARRELAESLGAGLVDHVAGLRRRVPGADVVVQVDEPLLPAVLAAAVPTASGFGRHRTVHPPEADALLRVLVEAIRGAGARPVVHSCARDVPVALLAGAGFEAVSFDAGLAAPDDRWAEAFASGTDLWVGVVPAVEGGRGLDAPGPARSSRSGLLDHRGTREVGEKAVRERLERFADRLGADLRADADRFVLTPACGMAGADAQWARTTLATLGRVAADLSA